LKFAAIFLYVKPFNLVDVWRFTATRLNGVTSQETSRLKFRKLITAQHNKYDLRISNVEARQYGLR